MDPITIAAAGGASLLGALALLLVDLGGLGALVRLVRIKPHPVTMTAAVNSDAFVLHLIHAVLALGALQIVYLCVKFHDFS